MNDSLSLDISSLNLDRIPADAYLKLARWATGCGREDIIDLNMGAYYDAYDSFYDSRASANAMLLNHFGPYFSAFYPSLRRDTVYDSQRIAKAEFVESIFKQLMNIGHNSRLHRMAAWRVEARDYRISQDTGMAGALARAFDSTPDLSAPALASLLSKDRSSWMQTILTRHNEVAINLLRVMLPMMERYCQQHNAVFELRDPLAYDAARVDELLSNQHPIQNPEHFMSRGGTAVLNTLWSIVLGEPSNPDTLVDHLWPTLPVAENPGAPDPMLRRALFNRWSGLRATAAIHCLTSQQSTVLTHSNMPTLLIAPHHDRLPVFLNQFHVPLINDTAYVIAHLHPIEVESLDDENSRNMDEHALPDADHVRIAAQTMSLIAACVSIIACNIKTGSGNHKPMWTHSPMNAHSVGFLFEAAPVILADFNKVIHGQ